MYKPIDRFTTLKDFASAIWPEGWQYELSQRLGRHRNTLSRHQNDFVDHYANEAMQRAIDRRIRTLEAIKKRLQFVD